jgi:poly-gamma-glutamate capsule biosynthesis protein CapA/YwtB (metallophosphatase superfamily)
VKKELCLLLFLFSGCDEPREPFVTIGFSGDVMLGRLVSDKISLRGPSYVWGDMLGVVSRPDITLINLETTFTKSKSPLPKVFNFKAKLAHVKALQNAGVDVVTLANNHSFDFGVEGFEDTTRALEGAGIEYIGAGLDDMRARKPFITQKGGITIGFLAYTDNEPGWKADRNSPGTNYLQVGDIRAALDDIDQVRSKVDVLVVSLHWGPNMRQAPSGDFVEFAHRLIEGGVDIVHGHSAHLFQGVEVYNGGLIMYDTGDFIDDYQVDPLLRNDQSFFFEVQVTKNGVKKLVMTPVLISNMQVNGALGLEAKSIVSKMEGLCTALGTKAVRAKDGTLIINVK